MSAAEVDALLERLVAQFESPYDFLRELVQNAMDAGSDRVEVTLESHPLRSSDPGADPDERIFELTVLDTGAGMDEAIIDQELTRLFSSGKSGDRTMAGGFGIGFVSVFAWEPEAVLVHTGRGGESWELVFYTDRSFDKVALEDPVEGTTISLFRRGRAAEREAIAEAIRDSLWRWCRFCPLELSFSDLDGDDPAELIQDSPEPAELGLGAGLTQAEVRGESTLRVSFAVPANAVFLRRGLILAEGGPKQLLSSVAAKLGRSVEHLQIWADSPLLRTSLARDKVLDDEGRVSVEGRLLELVAKLRLELLGRLEALAAVGEGELDELLADPSGPVDPRWTHERHAIYGALHAHLELEAEHLGRALRTRPILRDLAHAKAISLDAAIERMGGFALLCAPPLLEPENASSLAGVAALVRDLRPTTLPVLAGDLQEDRAWLSALLGRAEVELLPIDRAIARVEPRKGEAAGLCGLIATLLRQLGFEQASVELGGFTDPRGRPEASPVFGPEVPGAPVPLALHGGRTIPGAGLRRRKVWLNAHNLLVEAAITRFAAEPMVAGLALCCGLLGHLDRAPEAQEVAKLAEALERRSGAAE
ncbi:MAG: ATP-binding protein [Enhygromyxa sp.]